MSKNALPVEGDAFRFQIGVEARPRGDAARAASTIARKSPGSSRAIARGKGVAQAGDELKQRQIAIAHPAPDQMAVAPRVAFENPL